SRRRAVSSNELRSLNVRRVWWNCAISVDWIARAGHVPCVECRRHPHRLFLKVGRHGDRLAPEGLWPVLELEDSPWEARPPGGAPRGSPVDPYAQSRKSTLGSASHSRRTPEARHQHRRDQRQHSTWSGTVSLRHRPGGRSWTIT